MKLTAINYAKFSATYSFIRHKLRRFVKFSYVSLCYFNLDSAGSYLTDFTLSYRQLMEHD